ncbi:MAG: hypothetical protein JSR17_11620 [Proteobacteria bacterium]|nr:hypothetical protein [Pseudomonadota bacterium]
MLGRCVRYFADSRRSSPPVRATKVKEIKKQSTPKDEIDSLISQFRKLHVCAALPLPSSKKLKQSKHMDWHHLDKKGAIKEDILQIRKHFLEKHNLLQDMFYYRDRIVYANQHLYDIYQKDTLGRTNLQRMLAGFCPVDKTGQDIIIIHHFDQTMSGTWVVLTHRFHHEQSENLHSNVWVTDKVIRSAFKKERQAYWKFQAKELLECKQTSHRRPHL